MASIAARKTTWNALTPIQKAVLLYACRYVKLGDPAEFEAPGAVRWYVFDDHRISLDDMAILGVVAANLHLAPNLTGTPEQMRVQINDFVIATIKWPSTLNYTGVANPYQHTLTAQGAPASVAAADSVPTNWTAVSE